MSGKDKLAAIVPSSQPPKGLSDAELIARSIKNFPYRMLSKSAARVYDEDELNKSLGINSNEKYIEMDHYRNFGGTKEKGGHFTRLLNTNRRLQGRPEDILTPTKEDQNCGTKCRDGLEGTSSAEQPYAKQDPIHVQDRADWQHTFDRQVNQLFIDFQLSEVPRCRIHHLERMGAWYSGHGAKQSRKAKAGPSYLTADRSRKMPPGSTKDLPSTTNSTTLILRDEFMRPKRRH